jgi:outer membrane protein assembly factor BamD
MTSERHKLRPSRDERQAACRARAAVILAVISGAMILGACSTTSETAKQLNPDPPGKMFADADAALSRKAYDKAAKKFEDLERDHPYSSEARRAMVLAAFSYYKDGKLEQAIATAKRYTSLHPGTKEAPIAHDIIAKSYLEEMRTPDRDQSSTRKALAELRTLKARYPDSTQAKDADNRIRLCEDSLAASEMVVGRYSLKKKEWVAAKNRFETVVREYQNTAHVEEALMRLTEVNMGLGLREEAQNAAAVLGHNFPDSQWYKDAYTLLASDGLQPREDSSSWISRAWQGVKVPKLFSLGGPSQ